MRQVNYAEIIEEAWKSYDSSRPIQSITDISAMVSTNHVFRMRLVNGDIVIAKYSYFGKYEHFKEDHNIINALANNLPAPFENFLARSLMKKNRVFTYRHTDGYTDSWVVFYNPIKVKQKAPRRFDHDHIVSIARELAHFHQACAKVKGVLPSYSKTLRIDINHLLEILKTDRGRYEYRLQIDTIKAQSDLFLENIEKLDYSSFEKIPVFIDWNIGNFSVTKKFKLYSRWDYDWFRMSSRVMDFYFFSRIVSDIGDRTIFSYVAGPMMEERFILFLKTYHEIYPLMEDEVRFLKEAYRFFILNYVIKDGRYFFHEIYATKLQKEAFDIYLPQLEKTFDPEKLLKALNL